MEPGFYYNILTIILILGTGQAVFLTVLLLNKKVNKTANRLLAVTHILFATELFYCVYEITDLAKFYPHLIGVNIGTAFLYGPLIYLYIYMVSDETRKLNIKHLLHFIPFLLSYAYFQYHLLELTPEHRMVEIVTNFSSHPLLVVLTTIIPVFTTIYFIYGYLEVKNVNQLLKQGYSKIDFNNLYWLNTFTYGALASLAFVLLLHLFENLIPFDLKYLMFIWMSGLLYYIGFVNLKQPQVHLHETIYGHTSTRTDAELQEKSDESYTKSGLSKEILSELTVNLESIMEKEKPFLNPDLKLIDLANILNISTHNLSQVLNQNLKMNFYDFVNKYRVEEFKCRITEDKSKTFSILAHAYDSGFSSKTAFYTVFKKNTGITPTEFREKLAA